MHCHFSGSSIICRLNSLWQHRGDTQAATTETTQITETVQTAERIYSLTEENENQELTMARQPESSYWFPSELLSWDAKTDEDLRFNVSTVPFQSAPQENICRQ